MDKAQSYQDDVVRRENLFTFSGEKFFLLFVVSFLMFELLNGFLNAKTGINLLETLYYFVLLAFMFFNPKVIGAVQIRTLLIVLITAFSMPFLRYLFADNLTTVNFMKDIRVLISSFCFLLFSYFMFISFSHQDLKEIFRKICVVNWVLITLAILVHYFFGFGGALVHGTDIVKRSYFSFFQHGNQITGLYLVFSSYYIIFAGSLRMRLLVTALSALVMVITASKSGLLIFGVVLVIGAIYKIYFWSKSVARVIIGFLIFSVAWLLMNVDIALRKFLFFIVNYTSDGEKLSTFNSDDLADIITVIFARRNLDMLKSWEVISSRDWFEFMFGTGWRSFTTQISESGMPRDASPVENDFVDIIGAFGVLGVLFYFALPLVMLGFLIFRKWSDDAGHRKNRLLIILCLFSLLACSVTSGHIFIEQGTMLIIGFLCAFGLVQLNVDKQTMLD